MPESKLKNLSRKEIVVSRNQFLPKINPSSMETTSLKDSPVQNIVAATTFSFATLATSIVTLNLFGDLASMIVLPISGMSSLILSIVAAAHLNFNWDERDRKNWIGNRATVDFIGSFNGDSKTVYNTSRYYNSEDEAAYKKILALKVPFARAIFDPSFLFRRKVMSHYVMFDSLTDRYVETIVSSLGFRTKKLTMEYESESSLFEASLKQLEFLSKGVK